MPYNLKFESSSCSSGGPFNYRDRTFRETVIETQIKPKLDKYSITDEKSLEIALQIEFPNDNIHKLCDIGTSGRHKYQFHNKKLLDGKTIFYITIDVWVDTDKESIANPCCGCKKLRHTPQNECFGRICNYNTTSEGIISY